MISGEKIAQYISQPQHIEQVDLLELRALVQKYPYSSSLQLLELKGLALANSIDFEEKLKSTAIHAPDRGHLYEFIHSGEILENNETDSETIDSEPGKAIEASTENPENAHTIPTEETTAETIEHTHTEIKKAEKEVIKTPEETAEEIATTPFLESADEITIQELEKTENTETIPESAGQEQEETAPISPIEIPQDNAPSELDIDILNKAIDVAFVSSEIETKQPIEKEESLEKAGGDTLGESKISAGETAELPNQKTTESPQEKTVEAEVDTSKFTFIEWLRYKQEHKQDNSSKESKETLNAEQTTETDTEKPVEEVKIEKKKQPKITKTKNDIDALLDKFMVEEPRISRPVKDFYSPTKNARKSVEEPDDMVSETLAKIHVLQKNYSKAISAYEKLMLLYPEKKPFFASRIEKIKEESKKR